MPQFNKVVTELGRVIKNRGEWTSLASDTKLYTDNVVQYNHSAYIVKNADSGITKDATPDVDTAHYEIFAGVGTIDETPTPGSHNVVESGGVAEELAVGAVYDVTAHNDGAKFDSLAALLSDADINTLIPTAKRKGGMSIKFVLNSDNSYVQYMYKLKYINTTAGNNAFINTANWEKINLEEELNQIDTVVNGNNILSIVDVGFWEQDLSVNGASSFKRAKIDVSAYGLIEVNGSARSSAYISLVASDDSTILWQSNNVSAPFKIDLSDYQQPKYLYYCYEVSVVNNPYVNVLSLLDVVDERIGEISFQTGQKLKNTHIVNDLTTGGANDVLSAEQGKGLNIQLNGSTTTEEVTITADKAGYIKYSDGQVTNPTSSWKHTIMIDVDDFISVSGLENHGSVANIAFYSLKDDITSYVGGVQYSQDAISDLSDYLVQFPTAKYVIFSTDTSRDTLVCKYNITVVVEGLEDRIEDLEGRVETLEGSVGDINEVITRMEPDVLNLKKKVSVSDKMLHISFDDTINVFKDLIDNSRTSLFDSPFFGVLKTLHDTYGCVFSCYCFCDMFNLKYVSKITTISEPITTAIYNLSQTDESYSAGLYVYRNSAWTAYDNSTMREDYVLFSLSDMTNAYAEELSNNSDWLKFGFHGIDGLGGLGGITRTSTEIKTAYDNTISDIIRITGTVESIDMVPRLQGFGGSIDVCRALRDCDCGCLGFLTADYSETSGGSGGQSVGYYLTTPAPVVLWNKGQWHDYQERLHFYPSSLRLDSMTAETTETYMNKFLTVAKYGQSEMICMYCHENQMFANGSIGSNYVASLTKVAEWAVEHEYLFGYPMNRIRTAF